MAFLVQIAAAFQKHKIINTPFFYDFTFYTGQFIRHLKENVHIPISIFVKFPVNGKRTTLYAIFAALREESGPLFW